MTVKVNGTAQQGLWFERKAAFIKVVFNKDISALAAADLRLLGTNSAVPVGTVGSSVFSVVESAVVKAIKQVETKATVLGVSAYDSTGFSVDLVVGFAEGWFSDNAGVISSANAVTGAQAVTATGSLVTVADGAVTYDLKFGAFDGTLPVGTAANGTVFTGPGATSGATPVNSTTGTAGYSV